MVSGDEWWEEHVYTPPLLGESGCRNVGWEGLCILSCLLVVFLFHHKTLNFPLRRELIELPEGPCLGGIQPLPFDPFSTPFPTRSVSPAGPFQHFTPSRAV